MVKAESFSQTEKNYQQIHLFLFQFVFILRTGCFLSSAQVSLFEMLPDIFAEFGSLLGNNT